MAISIHSLRKEGDAMQDYIDGKGWNISIHSLRKEGDPSGKATGFDPVNFNPLPPHGGRLGTVDVLTTYDTDFNPLPPHGGRPITFLL